MRGEPEFQIGNGNARRAFHKKRIDLGRQQGCGLLAKGLPPFQAKHGVGAGIKFSTFCNYVAAIENSKIDPGCRTNITLPAAITSVK